MSYSPGDITQTSTVSSAQGVQIITLDRVYPILIAISQNRKIAQRTKEPQDTTIQKREHTQCKNVTDGTI